MLYLAKVKLLNTRKNSLGNHTHARTHDETFSTYNRSRISRNAHGNSLFKTRAEKAIKASHPPFLSPWSPPADLKRDLTPGTTPIRLAARTRKTDLNYPEGISIT